jgi:hypothetical protein
MASAFEALLPYVEWCDRAPPTDLGQAHILRTFVEPGATLVHSGGHPPILRENYVGTLAFARLQDRLQFTGLSIACVDPTLFGLAAQGMVIRILLFPHSGMMKTTFTACGIDHETAGAGPSYGPPFESTEVRTTEYSHVFDFMLSPGRIKVRLSKSTMSGLKSTDSP